jgi:hypothetical protein
MHSASIGLRNPCALDSVIAILPQAQPYFVKAIQR